MMLGITESPNRRIVEALILTELRIARRCRAIRRDSDNPGQDLRLAGAFGGRPTPAPAGSSRPIPQVPRSVHSSITAASSSLTRRYHGTAQLCITRGLGSLRLAHRTSGRCGSLTQWHLGSLRFAHSGTWLAREGRDRPDAAALKACRL